jgi:hypothetical protein
VVQLAVLGSLFVLATGFAVTSSRVITRAGRAERDTAARPRVVAAVEARRGDAPAPAVLLGRTFDLLAARRASDVPLNALRPMARLTDDLGLTAEDVEDVALLAVTACGGELPHAHDLDRLDRDVATVEELVRFVVPFVERSAATAARAA